MSDYVPTDEDLKPAIDALPKIPGIQEEGRNREKQEKGGKGHIKA